MKRIFTLLFVVLFMLSVVSGIIVSADDNTQQGEPLVLVTYNCDTGEEETTVYTPKSSTRTRSVDEESTPPFDPLDNLLFNNDAAIGLLSWSNNQSDYTKITNTNTFPYRAIGYVVAKWDRDGDGEYDYTLTGSGFLEGPDLLVTAAHVVYSDVYGWSKRVFFYAAKNGSSKPYGEAYSISNTISSAWSQNGNDDYDWSVITLNTNVGSSTGYLGKYRTSGSLVGTSVTTAGYPSLSTNAGYMQKSTGSVVSQTNYKVYSSYNVYNGLSGGPIYKDNGIAIGITTGYSNSESNALGVRFTKHVYDMLQEKLEESLEKYN